MSPPRGILCSGNIVHDTLVHPVDQMRWGAVLSRVSRLTEIPIDDLHRRFRKKKATVPSVTDGVVEPVTNGVKLPLAQELAERQMLGILLREPSRWNKLRNQIHPEDLAGEFNRRLEILS